MKELETLITNIYLDRSPRVDLIGGSSRCLFNGVCVDEALDAVLHIRRIHYLLRKLRRQHNVMF